MATSPRAFGLGPLETIVNVGWAGGWSVQIEGGAAYNEGSPGSRHASVTLTSAGVSLGGVIVSQEEVQTVDGMSFNATLEFSRQPTVTLAGVALFTVTLTGSILIVNEGEPPLLTPPFCGTSSGSFTWGPSYPVPNPFIPNGVQYFADWSFSGSSPAGSTSGSGTDGPLAGGREVETAPQVSWGGSDQSIWYQMANGQWVNTGLPCSQLEPGGGGVPESSSRVEGFGMTISVRDNKRPIPFNNPRQQSGIGVPYIGLSDDFVPIFSDLSDGAYKFAARELEFSGMPNETVNGKSIPFKSVFVYLLEPVTAKYSVMFRTNINTTYSPPTEFIPDTLPPNSFEIEKLFPAGTAPPTGQGYIFRL